MRVLQGTVVGLATTTLSYVACYNADGAPIFDRSQFDGLSSTLVDFETRGDGTPFGLAEGATEPLDGNQYLHLGFTFFVPDETIANSPDPDTEAAIAQVGSIEHTIFMLGGSGDEVGFIFETNDVHSVGISVVRFTPLLTGPLILRAYGREAPGQPITLFEEVVYDASFIQGQVGDVDFGFIGITSDKPIVNFLFDFANQDDERIQYDDLIFSTQMVPAPMSAAPLLLGALALSRRRRVI